LLKVPLKSILRPLKSNFKGIHNDKMKNSDIINLKKAGWDISGICLSKGGKLYKNKHRVVPIICDRCTEKGWTSYYNYKKSKYHFCSINCYQKSDQKKNTCRKAGKNKARIKRLIARNKTSEMRKKVSKSLKKRKKLLKNNYHSEKTKIRIGIATKKRWKDQKFKILPVLNKNAKQMQDKTLYGHTFRKIKNQYKKIIKRCIFCNKKTDIDLSGHHILPVRFGGITDILNIILSCRSCHKKIETFEWRFARKLYDTKMFSETEIWWIVYSIFNQILRKKIMDKTGGKICQLYR